MSRKAQLLLVALTVVGATSLLSHLLARWLGVRTQSVTALELGAPEAEAAAMVAGSSLGSTLRVEPFTAFTGTTWRAS
jgi:hypothetical protein